MEFTHDFSQNLKFLLSLSFSEKDLDKMLSNYFFLFTKKALMWCLMMIYTIKMTF